MGRALTLAATRTLVLLVLAASAALLYDYTQPLPAFCAIGAGCEAVRASDFAYVLGIPQPAIGLLAYLAVFGVTLARHDIRRKYLPPIATVGGVLGIAFLAIQAFWIQRFCWLCVVVDGGAVIIAALSWAMRDAQGHEGIVPRFVWALHAAAAVVIPFLFGASQPEPPAPAGVVRFWVQDKLTIVEISDFQCPHCRILHPLLTEAVEPHGDRINLVRLSVPLRSHPQAKTAAKAFVCAKSFGRGEPMAHALFETKDLSEEGCRAAAKTARLDEAAFARCFDSDKATKDMNRDVELAKAITFKGLPTLWIGEKLLIGTQSAGELRRVINEQLVGKGPKPVQLPHEWIWVLFGLDFLVLLGITAFRTPSPPST